MLRMFVCGFVYANLFASTAVAQERQQVLQGLLSADGEVISAQKALLNDLTEPERALWRTELAAACRTKVFITCKKAVWVGLSTRTTRVPGKLSQKVGAILARLYVARHKDSLEPPQIVEVVNHSLDLYPFGLGVKPLQKRVWFTEFTPRLQKIEARRLFGFYFQAKRFQHAAVVACQYQLGLAHFNSATQPAITHKTTRSVKKPSSSKWVMWTTLARESIQAKGVCDKKFYTTHLPPELQQH